MAVTMGGATVNGRKPVVSQTTHDYGTRGASSPSLPKQEQVATMGATDPGTGKKMNPASSKPDLDSPGNMDGQTTLVTTESMKKRLAGSMYPSSRGLREYMD